MIPENTGDISVQLTKGPAVTAPFIKRAAQRNPKTAFELQPDNATAAIIEAGPSDAVS